MSLTVGKGEIENITVGKGGGGCSTNDHMAVGKEGGGGLEGKGEGWERRGVDSGLRPHFSGLGGPTQPVGDPYF